MVLQVCGNLESVKFLSEWLHLWYERNSQNKKDFAGGNKFQKQDKNGYCSQSDSDYESPDGEDGLKNVLLVTGSSGVCRNSLSSPDHLRFFLVICSFI